jgi:hypothetical protein
MAAIQGGIVQVGIAQVGPAQVGDGKAIDEPDQSIREWGL